MVNWEIKMDELFLKIEKASNMVLATSYNDHVTARSVSTITNENKIYFQANKKSEKYQQIDANNRVAMTKGFIQIEGIATDIGQWSEHQELCQLYVNRHQSSYDAYGDLDGQTVIEVQPTRIKLWSYEGDDVFMYIWTQNSDQIIKVQQDKR